ncbi:type II secretion system F family protein [Gryllotalpicola daejeonensis]|uniref:Type II secretion system F family protein n=1 Tax=Gryllotalpicola daejeonensis TaxID=993087 RepID=A0ABP7ZJM8_9MICO
MPTMTYAYTARNAGGKLVKGKVEAQGEGSVTQRLRVMGLSPVSIAEAPEGTGLNTEINIGFGSGVKLKDLSIMARQMATMLGSGLSLLRTLNILAEQTENVKLAGILSRVRDDVETGVGLADSMHKHEDVFPPLMVNMVRAGEAGGFLDQSLDSIAVNFEKDVKLRDSIKSALTYPVIVLIMSLVGVLVMLTFVVPIFAKMFADFGSKLPVPTQMLVVLSHQMVWLAPTLIIGGGVFAWWWNGHKNDLKVRQFVDPLRLKAPVFGLLAKKIAIARFARNFSNMIGAGVPILQALQIVGETSGNWVIENALNNVRDAVRQGRGIAGPLEEQEVFPTMVTQMIAVGEDSGALETMLDKIADFYEADVTAMTEQLTALIEPLMIAFLGVVIGGMVVALYLPIFQITNAVQGSAG